MAEAQIKNLKELRRDIYRLKVQQRVLEDSMRESLGSFKTTSKVAYLKVGAVITVGVLSVIFIKKLRKELKDKPLAAAAVELAGEIAKTKMRRSYR